MRKIIFSLFLIPLFLGTALAAVDGQCSDLDTFYTANPRNSSLSDEDLCDAGNAWTVVYNFNTDRWTYKCLGTGGGTSDSCVVDLAEDNEPTCRVEVTDRSGVAPFSTSILCSGSPSGKTAIVISQNNTILDAIESDSETYDFDDAGVFTISCYPDVVDDRTNVCRTTVNVSGDCGNDVEESDEQCDDGNTTSGDGCNAVCQTEAADGSVCGNGVKESREQCDDGNNDDWDACTSICQNTTPHTGPMATLFVLLFLSLGLAGYYFYRKQKNIA
jgi:cysteine-rich repeat protein